MRRSSDGRPPAAVKVLMYHRIVDDAPPARRHWTCVHADELRRQMAFLDRLGFNAITFADERLARLGELTLPPKPVILTFDDGYLDTFRLAWPILEEFGMRGVVFVVGSGRIGTNVWDRANGIPETPLMGRREIASLARAGMEIGSHSLSHPDLRTVPEERAWMEIAHSKLLLEELLGTRVDTFSYPYGGTNERLKSIVAASGYEAACGVYSGPPSFGGDMLDIRRIAVPAGLSLTGFAARLLAPFERFEWAKRRIAQKFFTQSGQPGRPVRALPAPVAEESHARSR